MTICQRCIYAAYFSAVANASMLLILAVGSADVIGIFPTYAPHIVLSLPYLIFSFGTAVFFAPWLAPRLPAPSLRISSTKEAKDAHPEGLGRALVIAAVVMAITLIANLLAYFLG